MKYLLIFLLVLAIFVISVTLGIAGLIPVSDTLLTGFNIFITLGLIVVMPFITRMMTPKPSDVI
ncbi:TIGR00366 family protein, partial [Klebsiella pneumoniae]|uniref:TIGR00366 family protein n=1 Tax=Klebsiella pneumoniae TaxID=573 RepID=UPI001E2A80C3